jgi:hypothetical protein
MISRRSVAAVAALAATALVTVSGAAAEPAPHAVSRSHASLPPITGGSDTGVFTIGTTTVRKAKAEVALPLTVMRAYANEISHITKGNLYSRTPSWAVSHVGRHPRFGTFPVAHSAVLGFGAVPITADLHLTQLVRAGRVLPINVYSKNQVNFPFKEFPTHVRGRVEVRIANVRVDRVPLDVGPDCHSAVPMTLSLRGTHPTYNLFTGGPLYGRVTIPQFTGCGSGGDDLDPLLNGMISGPGNRIVLHQGNLGVWDPSKPRDCDSCHPPKA